MPKAILIHLPSYFSYDPMLLCNYKYLLIFINISYLNMYASLNTLVLIADNIDMFTSLKMTHFTVVYLYLFQSFYLLPRR